RRLASSAPSTPGRSGSATRLPAAPRTCARPGGSCAPDLDELARALGVLEQLPDAAVRVVAVADDRVAVAAQRILDGGADRVDAGAAALAHALRAERRERRGGLDVAGAERRHVERVRDVVVVEVRRQQVAVLVVLV